MSEFRRFLVGTPNFLRILKVWVGRAMSEARDVPKYVETLGNRAGTKIANQGRAGN